MQQALNQGSSVIMEAWHLDAVSEGKISPILAQCGVVVYPYFPENGNTTDVMVYQIQGVQHPILMQPNQGIGFSRALNTWLWTYDLGSLMALTGKGDAQLLMVGNSGDAAQDGVVASCMQGKLTLMTFSSHSFSFQDIFPLWQNMIYNALKVRYQAGG